MRTRQTRKTLLALLRAVLLLPVKMRLQSRRTRRRSRRMATQVWPALMRQWVLRRRRREQRARTLTPRGLRTRRQERSRRELVQRRPSWRKGSQERWQTTWQHGSISTVPALAAGRRPHRGSSRWCSTQALAFRQTPDTVMALLKQWRFICSDLNSRSAFDGR